MTRASWADQDQHLWLEARKAQFIEVNQRKAAAKEFFPDVVKEFREKWPVSPVTPEEIEEAGSQELAIKKKRDKHDKRVRDWFHNNTRNVASTGHSILKVKAKPKMLQSWQAYHALTYQTKWKSFVQERWSAYQTEWASEHPDEKPPKGRFQIMVEFMKEKYAGESPEMKAKCEEYRQNRRVESPAASAGEEATRNIRYQSSIMKLPRTLETMGASLMEQTGWHITILAGGPSPEHDGMIMTFLSHAGKTKNGETFERFLGKEEYDKSLLLPFERFLHSSFSAEDCSSRKLVKVEANLEVSDEEWCLKQREDGEDKTAAGDGSKKVATGSNEDGRATGTKSQGLSEYEISKAKNIAELRRQLAEVDKEYPFPEELRQKKEVRKQSSSKKDKAPQGEAVRRESTRIKGANASATPTATVPPSITPTSKSPPTVELPTNIVVPVDHQHDHPTLDSVPSAFNLPINAQTPGASPLAIDSGPVSISNSESAPAAVNLDLTHATSLACSPATPVAVGVSSNVCGEFAHQPTESAQEKSTENEPMRLTHTPTHVAPDPSNISGDLAHQSTESAHGKPTDGERDNDSDVIMADDSDLPTYLVPMIGYLRAVAADRAWQDLVTNLVGFEKVGRPSSGNLSTKSRPQEVSDWIKSKKKDIVPSINPDVYGARFMEWWGGLQPSWRQFKGGNSLLHLVRETPKAETWQALKKGGTSGIYVVVMALSWWIKGQRNECDANAWAVVDDLSWVIRQMSDGHDSLASTVQKRPHDHGCQGNEVEDQPLQKRSRH